MARRFKAWYESLKENTPCTDCGLVFPAIAMQWDHLPGTTKYADLGDLGRRNSRARVLDEIANANWCARIATPYVHLPEGGV
jgi:hypothetical protein